MKNIKNKKGLSITMVFKAQSLNYGEGIGNISELKKLTRGDGSVYTFASRQAIRYDIVRLGNKMFNWNLQVVNKEKGTIQFDDKLTIQDSEEMDLFGYMKTAKNDGSNVRSAAVRLSNAISLEDYKSDMEFLNNKGLADRIGEFPNLANIEQHLSYYTYTITIDLEKIGKDEEIELSNEEKTERNAGYLVVSHSGGGMLRQGTRKGIRRTPANRGMRAHWVVKGLDISEDVCHGMCP